jgi:AcrR family transcriptional regulator
MSKGDETRERIIRKSATLFNRKGFFGASVSDIMEATGLKKGGIYNYFESKEDLALQAFEYASELHLKRFREAIASQPTGLGQLIAVARTFQDFALRPPLSGGCPMLNTAIESDDAHPSLRAHARAALDAFRALIADCVERGVADGGLRADVDADAVATVFIATLEGGVMLGRLYREAAHVHRTVAFVCDYLNGLAP